MTAQSYSSSATYAPLKNEESPDDDTASGTAAVCDSNGLHFDEESLLSSENLANPFNQSKSNDVSNSSTSITPLPWKSIFVLGCILSSEAMTASVIFPFVGFMVKGFRVAENDKSLGYYAGFLAASYFFAQVICSFFYGWLSDRIGRRPVLLFGLTNVVLCTTLFAFSPNILWAIFARLLTGMLNGNVGVAKTYMAEITDETNQSKGFSILSTVWSIGNVLGPAMGGFLAQPARKWPTLFPPGSFFSRYEYVLPCFAASSVALIGLLAGIFFLPEPDHSQPVSTKRVDKNRLKPSAERSLETLSEESLSSSLNLSLVSTDDLSAPSASLLRMYLRRAYRWIRRSKLFRILRQQKILISVCLYTFLGFGDVVFEEVFPLWSLVAPKDGGLGFTTSHIGGTVSIGSLTLLLIQVFVFPRIERKLGPLQMFQWGCFICSAVLCLFPTIHFLAIIPDVIPEWLLFASVLLGVISYYIPIAMTFVSVFILCAQIANSTDRSNLGSVNGLAQSTVAMTRALAPVFGGTILAWSLNNGLIFPFNYYFVFILMACCHFLNCLLSYRLPASINRRAEDSSSS